MKIRQKKKEGEKKTRNRHEEKGKYWKVGRMGKRKGEKKKKTEERRDRFRERKVERKI